MTSIVTQALGGSALLAVFCSPRAMATSVDQQVDKITAEADQLYDSNRWKEALTYLEQYADSTDVEVLWRLARLCYKVGPTEILLFLFT